MTPAAASFLAALGGLLAATAAAAQVDRSAIRSFPPDAWVTLADFRHVTAVAVTMDAAFLGTTGGVERFDTLRERWLAPLTEADGLPDDVVTALAVEPTGGTLWIGTRRGLARLDELSGEVDRAWGPPPVRVDEIRLDPRDGTAWAFVGGIWWAGRGGSPALERADGRPPADAKRPASVDDLDPFDLPWTDPLYVRSSASRGAVFRLTAIDRDPRGDWYVGTWGDNGRRWGSGRQDWEDLHFGLAGPGGGPIVSASGGLWFLNGAASPGGLRVESAAAASGAVRAAWAVGSAAADGIAFAAADGGWSYAFPGEDEGLPTAAARAAIALGDTLYVGSDHGLTRLLAPAADEDDRPRAERAGWRAQTWGWREDEPRGPVLALAADGPTLWVGGEEGLLLWDRREGGVGGRFLRGLRVSAILPSEGALFVGTDSGLYVGQGGGPAGAPPDSFGRARTLGRGVRALVERQGVVLVATEAGVEAFDRRSGDWTVTRVDGGRLPAPPLALAADGEQVWIGTARGLVRWRPETDEWETLGTKDGLAAERVQHLLALEDELWCSTPAGATRFAWTLDR